jgi:hypothetical protein
MTEHLKTGMVGSFSFILGAGLGWDNQKAGLSWDRDQDNEVGPFLCSLGATGMVKESMGSQ